MQVATRALDPDPRTFLSLIRIRIYFPSESRREKLKEKNEKMKELVVIGFFIQKFNLFYYFITILFAILYFFDLLLL